MRIIKGIKKHFGVKKIQGPFSSRISYCISKQVNSHSTKYMGKRLTKGRPFIQLNESMGESILGCTNECQVQTPICTSMIPSLSSVNAFKSFQSLEEVQVTHVKWRVFGNCNLVIIKDCPPTILADMGNIVTTVGRSANVAHNSSEFISCKRYM